MLVQSKMVAAGPEATSVGGSEFAKPQCTAAFDHRNGNDDKRVKLNTMILITTKNSSYDDDNDDNTSKNDSNHTTVVYNNDTCIRADSYWYESISILKASWYGFTIFIYHQTYGFTWVYTQFMMAKLAYCCCFFATPWTNMESQLGLGSSSSSQHWKNTNSSNHHQGILFDV